MALTDNLSALDELAVGRNYRAKDIPMHATIVRDRRLVLVTGAIDTNDHSIVARIDLPDAGRWDVVKSETNLTSRSWIAWQIGLGEGTLAAPDGNFLCDQLPQLHIPTDCSRITFYGGEIRPGAAILKLFTVETKLPRIVMAHNRELDDDDDDGQDIPIPVAPEELRARVVAGFAPKPPIDAFLPVTVL